VNLVKVPLLRITLVLGNEETAGVVALGAVYESHNANTKSKSNVSAHTLEEISTNREAETPLCDPVDVSTAVDGARIRKIVQNRATPWFDPTASFSTRRKGGWQTKTFVLRSYVA
jgi:hypothetical protein